MTTDTLRAARADERMAEIGLVRRIFRRPEVGAVIGAAAVWLFFAIVAPENWISVQGIARILDPSSTLGIMAVAVALLMIGGEFDLSTGVMTGTSGLIAGLLATELGMNLWLAMFLSLLFALAVGYINGIMVIKTGLPSFIVTLATFFILRGANVGTTRLLVNQVRVSGIDKATGFEAARLLFNTEISLLGTEFRTTILWWLALTALATWVLLRTKYGSWIFAVGGDAEAARNVGVPAARVKVALFMTTAGAAWLVGIMNDLRLRSAVASQGIGQEFVYIIAAVIGGCLLTGGYGSAIGAAVGAVIFGMAQVGIVFAGWDTDWFFSFLGIMLLAAVIVNNYTRKRAEAVSVAVAKSRTEDKEEA
ncbi:MAG: ABC transporter permease [Caldilineae bacterium]|nr:MAG: ABC transporter permease [Caldilineae bacterium]